MADHRKHVRLRALKAAKIAFDRAAVIDCLVRNQSVSGACLEVVSPVGIPDRFNLVFESDRITRPCRVVWRSATRIGISFEDDKVKS